MMSSIVGCRSMWVVGASEIEIGPFRCRRFDEHDRLRGAGDRWQTRWSMDPESATGCRFSSEARRVEVGAVIGGDDDEAAVVNPKRPRAVENGGHQLDGTT